MNRMECLFMAHLQNETLARSIVSAFLLPYNPSIDEMMEIKTMVAEAVANAIIHGYEIDNQGMVFLSLDMNEELELTILVKDEGVGIENIELAKTPLYTSKAHLERSGMGFTIMESFADECKVESILGGGTSVTMKKRLQFAHEQR